MRDPGDALWSEIFDLLPGVAKRPTLHGLCDYKKGDFLELTRGAAAVVLDGSGRGSSLTLQKCLHSARLLIEDLARTAEEIHVRTNPAASALVPKDAGMEVRQEECMRCGTAVFGRYISCLVRSTRRRVFASLGCLPCLRDICG